MDTRLRTNLRAGESRLQYQQFDYFTSKTDDEHSEAMIPILTYPQDLEQPPLPIDPPPESVAHDPVSDLSVQDCLPQFFFWPWARALTVGTTTIARERPAGTIPGWNVCTFAHEPIPYWLPQQLSHLAAPGQQF